MAVLLKTRRFTVDEYRRMGETGILSADDRVELIEGEIVEMTPIGPLHAGTVDRAAKVLSSTLGDRAIVRVQNPVQLRVHHSEVQPDLALLRPRPDYYTRSHPEAPDVLLVVEVADTSVERDRRIKLPIYGRSGIRESWLIDLGGESLEAHRQPGPEGYGDVTVFHRGELITADAFPDLILAIDDLLGPA